MKRLVFLLFFCISFFTFSQEGDNKENGQENTETENSDDELIKRIKDLLKPTNTSTNTGVFYSPIGKPIIKVRGSSDEDEASSVVEKRLKESIFEKIKKNVNIDSTRIDSIANAFLKDKLSKIDDEIEKISLVKADTPEKRKEKQSQISEKITEKKNLLEKEIARLKKDFATPDLDFYKKELGEDLWTIKQVDIEITEGVISDLRVYLKKPSIDTTFVFANRTAISITRFHRYLKHKLFNTNNSNQHVLLKDVLNYRPAIGKNFAPDDTVITIKEKNYEYIKLETSLNSILDFRSYTDFLGVIDQEDNGILNLEFSSKIYLNTSPVTLVRGTQATFFKDIFPYFTYSRLDNEDKSAVTSTENDTIIRISNKLDLLQKAFIRTGVKLDVMEFKFEKEFPMTFSFPLRAEFNMTEINNPISNNSFTSNTYVWSYGVEAHLRRFKLLGSDQDAFGLNIEALWNHADNKQSIDNFEIVNYYKTLSLSYELFFFGKQDKNSAVFLRLFTNRVIGGEANYSALQLGYKKAFSF